MRNAGWILLTLLAVGCTSGNSVQSRQELRAGYDSLAQQDYNAAMTAADQFIREHPNSGPGTAEALYLQGRVYEQRAIAADSAGRETEARGDLQYARGTYEHALTLNPNPQVAALLHAGVANVAYFQEDYPAAMQQWAQSYDGLADDDAKAWVLYRIGVSQQRLGWFGQADKNFALVRQKYPRSEPAQRAAGHIGATGFYVQVGAYTDAGNADRTTASLQSQGFRATKATEPGGKQAVRVGPAQTYAQAKSLRSRLLAAFPGALIEP